MGIPAYQTLAGQRYLEGSMTKADVRWRIVATMEREVRAYAQDLLDNGFTLHQLRVIDSEYPDKKNLFYCFYKGDTCVYVFFDASKHTVFITSEPKGDLPPVDKCATGVITPTITQMPVGRMAYVIRLADGAFICIDGGWNRLDAVRELYEFLKANTLDEKPRIALWLFTHAHEDHIQLASAFLREYAQKVQVDAFAYQFSDLSKSAPSMNDFDLAEIETFERSVALYPNAKRYVLHTGQKYYFSGVEMEVLYSLDNVYPAPYTSLNSISAAVRFQFDCGKTAMFLGDCMCLECRDMAYMYGDYLKSDILQVTHHGLIGGDRFLYEKIDADICLWPVNEKSFLGQSGSKFQWCLGEGGCDYNAYLRDERIKKRMHYHGEKMITIEIR